MSSRLPALMTALCLSASLSGCGTSETDETTSGNLTEQTSEKAASASSEARKLVEEAIALMQQGSYGTAVERLTKALQTDATCADAWFQRAGILADAGRDPQALSDYTKAVELNPNEVRYRNMRGLFLLSRRQLDQAFADFTRVIELDPKYVQSWNNRGLVHLAKQDVKSAIEDFSKTIEIDPDYLEGLNNRGYAWFQSGDQQKALSDFNQTIKKNPDYVNAYVNRGVLFTQAKMLREAVADFSEAIKRDENNPKHYQKRYSALLELGMVEQAQKDAERVAWLMRLSDLNLVVARDPQKASSYVERASHLAQGGHHDIAQANFEQAIKVDPEYSESLIARGRYWYERGDFEKTIEDATAALRKKFSYQALSLRADACMKLNRFDEAIADYSAAKRLDPDVAKAYWNRGLARQKAGDQSGARSDFEWARQLDPAIGQ